MKLKIVFIERKASASVSIERVFRQIAKELANEFDVEFQQLPYGYGIFAIIKNLLFFHPRPADVYHITGDVHYIALRLPGRKTVLTIHDLVFLRRRTGLRRALLKWLFLTAPVNRVAKVTTISDATRNEIAAEMPTLAKPVEVITNPLIDGFVAEPIKPFEAERPVILQMGTAPNKNIETLIEALRGFSCRLRIIGALSEDQKRRLAEAAVEYSSTASLDSLAIVEEYRNADIVTICSTYEGFGLPIIEAQMMRKPVVTSDLPPMNDVSGEGAVLVDAMDAAAIRAGIERICKQPIWRRNLIGAGLLNVGRFASESIATSYKKLYQTIMRT